jgi:quercetin dioxygenase-like cupin family protein
MPLKTPHYGQSWLSHLDQTDSQRYVQPVVVPARVVWMPGGVRTEIHLTGDDTGGVFCLLVDQPPAGWRLPAHRHKGVAETIHIVDGEFEMRVAGQDLRLGAGETVHIPADAVHAGGNVGEATGGRIVIFSPAGMEGFFLETGSQSPAADINPREALASAIRYGWEFLA